jgi:hypothetical protein
MLFPLPIQIPAWSIGLLLLGIDLLTFNIAGFAGMNAAYLMIHYV